MEGNERSIYMDAPVCLSACPAQAGVPRTGRQDEHGCFLFHEELWNPHLTSPMGEGFPTPEE